MIPAESCPPGLHDLPDQAVRPFRGTVSDELHAVLRPSRRGDLSRQVAEVYQRLHEALRLAGQDAAAAVREMVFFRDIDRDLPAFLAARDRALLELGSAGAYRPATTFVGQPPIASPGSLEVLLATSAPHHRPGVEPRALSMRAACGCAACGEVHLRAVGAGRRTHLHAGNVVGTPGSAYDEAYDMLRAADALLRQEGSDFRSVVRTWIYLRDMEHDYGELNRARRDFFARRGIAVPPASTGIRGLPFVPDHRLQLAFHAMRPEGLFRREPMTAATLNEAPEYGSDFSRGMRVVEEDRIRLHVSGTASVDEEGRTAYPGDLERQADRMLLNVCALLANEGASFDHVVSGITYLKHAEDAPRLLQLYRDRGIEGFAHALVNAEVCRPDLLCEMEVTAVLPRPGGRAS